MKQASFADMTYDQKKKTGKEQFLGEMNTVLPGICCSPHPGALSEGGGGRRPIGAGVMSRIYFMLQWYGLSDPGMEDSLYDVESMRCFADLRRPCLRGRRARTPGGRRRRMACASQGHPGQAPYLCGSFVQPQEQSRRGKSRAPSVSSSTCEATAK